MRATNLISVTLAGGVETQVIGPDVKRVRLEFSTPQSSQYYVRPDSAGNNAGGFNIATSSGSLILTIEEHGDIVKGQWFAFSAAGVNLGILHTQH